GIFIRSQTLPVRDGKARIELAPGDDLKGEVTMLAYDADEDTDAYFWSRERVATRTVLYPKHKTLELTARFERDSVKPAEMARVAFASKAFDGGPLETSLGVVVFDSAVEERARTEFESGERGYFGDYYGRLLGWNSSMSDVTLQQLEQLDQSKPFPPDL